MRKIVFILFLCIGSFASLFAQTEPAWDNTSKRQWDPAFEKVEIPSTKDGEVQKAFKYKSTNETSQPLIVSLHTWSGYYNQTDPLTK